MMEKQREANGSFLEKVQLLKETEGGFLVGSVVMNLPARCRRHRFHPWSGQIPHSSGN